MATPLKPGVWTALITPFLEDGGIDLASFDRLLARQIEAQMSGVVIAGSTGEGVTLTVTETLSLIKRTRAALPAGLGLMANVGSSSTAQTVEMARLAGDAGADSLLVVTPPYNRPTQGGLTQHFQAIADVTRLPLVLYHNPARTGRLMNADDFQALAAIPAIQGVKEASANMTLFAQAVAAGPWQVFTGEDPTFLPCASLGAAGLISIIANLFPRECQELWRATQRGDWEKARRLHFALLPAILEMGLEPNPIPIKAAMAAGGWCRDAMRLPLTPLAAANRPRLEEALAVTRQRLSDL